MSSDSSISTQHTDERENFLLWDRLYIPLAEPEMILEGLWPTRTIGLFTGDGGVGKTHWALQLSMAIASGGKIEGTPFKGLIHHSENLRAFHRGRGAGSSQSGNQHTGRRASVNVSTMSPSPQFL